MGFDVSVVMSVYNGAKYLHESIDSILGQTLKNFEFVIIDDGSTDNSREVIQSYNDSRIVLIEQSNTGLAVALNNAIKKTTGSLIARMDADDISMPERLERQTNFLNENPDYSLVGTNARVIDMNGNYIYCSDLPILWTEIKKEFPFPSFFHSSVMFRKETFNKAGGYFEGTSKLYSFEDCILWNRMRPLGMMANLEQPLLNYRLLPNAATTKSGKDGKTISGILVDIIRDNKLSDENKEKLQQIVKRLDIQEKTRLYHLHIAKKYLFNNYLPQEVRHNVRSALKYNSIKAYPYLLYLLSLLPESFVKQLYSIKKG